MNGYYCNKCNSPVRCLPVASQYECKCYCVSFEAMDDGLAPSDWQHAGFWTYKPTPNPVPAPVSGDNCQKCGKAMTVQGLNRDYPPKRDSMGRAVCPHCGEASGPGVTGFGNYVQPYTGQHGLRGSTHRSGMEEDPPPTRSYFGDDNA